MTTTITAAIENQGDECELRTVALAALLVVSSFQIRKGTDSATVSRYAGVLRAGRTMPPVTVGLIDGALVLLDGFHRVAAHREVGASDIEAHVILTTAGEARWVAAKANMSHGLPLRRAEVRDAFRAFIRARQHLTPRRRLMSLREVAEKFGAVSHSTIHAWLQKDFPQIARQYAAEAPRGGGLRDTKAPSLEAIAADSLAQALAAARGVTSPAARGELVEAFRGAVEVIEKGGPFELPERELEPEPTPAF